MDNMVITERGVGFVDFGSAVRVDENIEGNAVLSTLFGELMRTSQIQRMLDRMSTAGSLTSGIIRDAYQQVDKSVDIFYLAVQMSHPTANPDLVDLIHYDKFSPEATELSRLTDEILRPADPAQSKYRSAYDIYQAILRIEEKLKLTGTPRVVFSSAPENQTAPVSSSAAVRAPAVQPPAVQAPSVQSPPAQLPPARSPVVQSPVTHQPANPPFAGPATVKITSPVNEQAPSKPKVWIFNS